MATQKVERYLDREGSPPAVQAFSVEEVEREKAESGSRNTAEMLAQVPLAIPTSGLVFQMARCTAVYTWRPVLFLAATPHPLGERGLVYQTDP
jgi:hypothetical protein